MGAYLDQADLVPALIEERIAVQLTRDTVGAETVDGDRVAEAIAAAEAEVDGYLAARHNLPLASVPPLVVDLARRLARFKLYSRRPWMIKDELREEHKLILATLRDISKGVLVLSVPEPDPNPERIVRSSGTSRVFGRANLRGF